MKLPYMALHFLEHGSFFMSDTTRIDVDTLLQILAPVDTAHQIYPVSGDSDSDGLRDDVEAQFNMSPDSVDSDHDGVEDGQEAAEMLIRQILTLPVADELIVFPPEIPYIQFFDVYGIEKCTICGETFNMGMAKICNPGKSKEIEFPIIALHYLAHGRFAYSGEVHAGEIDAAELLDILQPADASSCCDHPAVQTENNFSLVNYPNPFNPVTTIEYTLPERSSVRFIVYNTLGKEVFVSDEGIRLSGTYSVSFDASYLPSGVYFYELETDFGMISRKMLYIR